MSRAPFTFAPAPELDGHLGDPLTDLLDLEEIDTDLYRSQLLFADHYDKQVAEAPPFPPPEECAPFALPRLFSMESRGSGARMPHEIVPRRFWARSSSAPAADDQLLHACVLTYLSDISSGLHAIEDDHARASASLDHAVWFHRPVRTDDWTLTDVVPHSAAGGRGWYTGSVFDTSGRLVASFTQEALFRRAR